MSGVPTPDSSRFRSGLRKTAGLRWSSPTKLILDPYLTMGGHPYASRLTCFFHSSILRLERPFVHAWLDRRQGVQGYMAQQSAIIPAASRAAAGGHLAAVAGKGHAGRHQPRRQRPSAAALPAWANPTATSRRWLPLSSSAPAPCPVAEGCQLFNNHVLNHQCVHGKVMSLVRILYISTVVVRRCNNTLMQGQMIPPNVPVQSMHIYGKGPCLQVRIRIIDLKTLSFQAHILCHCQVWPIAYQQFSNSPTLMLDKHASRLSCAGQLMPACHGRSSHDSSMWGCCMQNFGFGRHVLPGRLPRCPTNSI